MNAKLLLFLVYILLNPLVRFLIEDYKERPGSLWSERLILGSASPKIWMLLSRRMLMSTEAGSLTETLVLSWPTPCDPLISERLILEISLNFRVFFSFLTVA